LSVFRKKSRSLKKGKTLIILASILMATIAICGCEGPGPTTHPTAPRNLQGIAGDENVTLTWQRPIDDGNSSKLKYCIYRNNSLHLTIGSNYLTVLDNLDVLNGVTYYYQVYAVNSRYASPPSNMINATPRNTVLSEPRHLLASAGDGQVSLFWEIPRKNAGAPVTNYKIYRNGTLITQIGTATLFTDTNVKNNETYLYQVAAMNSIVDGLKSGPVSATPRPVAAFLGKLLLHMGMGPTQSVAWSPDGTEIATGSTDGRIRTWDAQNTRQLLTLVGHTSHVLSIAWSPNGTKIASGSADNTIKIWNAQTGAILQTLTGHSDYVETVSWSPDGTKIVSGSDDHTIKIWNARSGLELQTLAGHADFVYSVAWSPNGSLIASGSKDSTVKIWDAQTGTLLHRITGHERSVYSVAWSPNGTELASGALDLTIKIWNAQTGGLLQNLSRQTDSTYSVAWSPDGTKIVAGSYASWGCGT